ncbi:hypothetical protein HPB47_015435, partial [Ixodes persulcatus]
RLNVAAVSLLLGLCWPFANGRNTTCGGFLTQFRGSFQSPNYPDHYDDSSECRWYIFAPREFAILIEKHSIDIEDDAARADCPYDHLKKNGGAQGDERHHTLGESEVLLGEAAFMGSPVTEFI